MVKEVKYVSFVSTYKELKEMLETPHKTYPLVDTHGREYSVYIVGSRFHDNNAIGTTRQIPPNRRSCLGCIWWKDMSNPKRLR